MKKIDFQKELKSLYNASSQPVMVNVPAMNYLMIDGKGDPNTSVESKEAIETLYPVAYAIKFKFKKENDIDFGVMPLEGLWWTEDMKQFTTENKDIWQWTYMIQQPDFVTENIFKQTLEDVARKKLPAILKLRFISLDEGLSAQIMHVGPFSEEASTIQKLHSFIKDNGYKIDGLFKKHHEIYLSDYRKTQPQKLKTIIRQPVIQ